MSDESLRELERAALTSRDAGEALTKELRRCGRAFENCDWCWGAGWRLVAGVVKLCAACWEGKPEPLKPVPAARGARSSGSHWRDTSVRRVAATLEALPKAATEAECRVALRRAYPFGPRQYHPCKIWCDEVKKQIAKRFGVEASAPLLDDKAVSS